VRGCVCFFGGGSGDRTVEAACGAEQRAPGGALLTRAPASAPSHRQTAAHLELVVGELAAQALLERAGSLGGPLLLALLVLIAITTRPPLTLIILITLLIITLISRRRVRHASPRVARVLPQRLPHQLLHVGGVQGEALEHVGGGVEAPGGLCDGGLSRLVLGSIEVAA